MARILLVDDQQPVLDTVYALLVSDGHEVIPVADGAKAIELISSDEEFDLLTTDIRMEPIDGMEILRLAHDIRPGMPVVVISAYCSDTTISEAKQLGCTEYVKKPFKIDEVLGAVRRVVGSPAEAH